MGLRRDSSEQDVGRLLIRNRVDDLLLRYDSKRVFLLGPSHHFYLNKIALTKCAKYATPLGDIPIDTESKSRSCRFRPRDPTNGLPRVPAIQKLKKSGMFDEMDLDTDSDEHSLEMHLPYIRLMFKDSCVSGHAHRCH